LRLRPRAAFCPYGESTSSSEEKGEEIGADGRRRGETTEALTTLQPNSYFLTSDPFLLQPGRQTKVGEKSPFLPA